MIKKRLQYIKNENGYDCRDSALNLIAKLINVGSNSPLREVALKTEENWLLGEPSVTDIAKKMRELNAQLSGAKLPLPKLIYIAGKYTGRNRAETERNIEAAKSAARVIWNNGHVGVCPQANSALMDYDPECTATYDQFVAGYIELMLRCDAVYFMPDWQSSRGATQERAAADKAGLPVFEDMAVMFEKLANVNGEM